MQNQIFSPPCGDLLPSKQDVLPWSPSVDLEVSKKVTNQILYDSNFNIIRNDIFLSRLDWMHLIVGEEGSGKTRTAVYDCLRIDPKFSSQSKDLPQVIFSVTQLKEFIDLWRENDFYQRRGVAILFDEANKLFSAKKTLSKDGMEIEELLTQIRAEFGFFMVANFQSFRQPQSYVRNDRVKSLCRTSLVFDKNELRHKTGIPRYYNRPLIKEIKKLPDGRISWPKRPNFIHEIPKENPVLYEQINNKKYDFLVETENYKMGKRLNERKKDKLLLDLQISKMDGDLEKENKIRKLIDEL